MQKIPYLGAYSLQARFFPAAILTTPVIVSTFINFPDLYQKLEALLSILLGFGFAILASLLARWAGVKIQPSLFEKWDGPPATAMLRHRDKRLSIVTKKRYNANLSKLIPGWTTPSLQLEKSNPDKADTIFDSAVDWLRQKTRNKEKFHLIFAENKNYGFARNMLGLKPFGIGLCALTLGGDLVNAFFFNTTLWSNLEYWVSIIINLSFLFMWLLLIKPKWVKIHAEGYARAILEASDNL